MAQYTITPEPTQKELQRAAALVRKLRKERGMPGIAAMGREMGMHETEVSRILNASLVRKWGYARLSRIARWTGLTIDGLLGRPEGTTRVMQASGAMPELLPLAAMDERELFQMADVIAGEKLRLRSELGRLLKDDYPDEDERARKVEALAAIIEPHADRIIGLRDAMRERTKATTRGREVV